MTDVELDAQHQADRESILKELRQKNDRIAELEVELSAYRDESKTWPPGSLRPSEQDTGDQSKARDCAILLQRVDNLEERESARAGALQDAISEVQRLRSEMSEVKDSIGWLKLWAESHPVVDPNDIKEIKESFAKLKCMHCPDEPPEENLVHLRQVATGD